MSLHQGRCLICFPELLLLLFNTSMEKSLKENYILNWSDTTTSNTTCKYLLKKTKNKKNKKQKHNKSKKEIE